MCLFNCCLLARRPLSGGEFENGAMTDDAHRSQDANFALKLFLSKRAAGSSARTNKRAPSPFCDLKPASDNWPPPPPLTDGRMEANIQLQFRLLLSSHKSGTQTRRRES